MKKNNRVFEKLRSGKIVFGPWCVIPSAAVMDITASAGFDFVIIDMEHGPTSFETVGNMIRNVNLNGSAAIVRLGNIQEEQILKSLDLGADGLMVAHVEKKSDAERVIQLSKYHPIGIRGFSPYTPAGLYSGGDIEEHAELQNLMTITGIIVEGREGIEAIDEILETQNLDLIYIGAYDLSQALGIPGQVNDPRVRETMELCVKKIRDKGIAAGGYVAKDSEDMKWMIDMGMQFITYLPDCAVFYGSMKKAVDRFKSILVQRS